MRTKARTKRKPPIKKVINGGLPYISSQSHHPPAQRGCYQNSWWCLTLILMGGMLKVDWRRGITWFHRSSCGRPRPLLPSGNPPPPTPSPLTLMEQMKVRCIIEEALCRRLQLDGTDDTNKPHLFRCASISWTGYVRRTVFIWSKSLQDIRTYRT